MNRKKTITTPFQLYPFGGNNNVLRMLASILYIGAVLLLALLLVGCVKDNGNGNGSSNGGGVVCDATDTSIDCSCSDRKLIDDADGDCDGDGVENGTDAFNAMPVPQKMQMKMKF